MDITDFTTVDQTGDPAFFARFLDAANRNRSIIDAKPLILKGLQLQEGHRVLDAGCGMGADVFAIAERVGAAGHVTGVDFSEALIDVARKRAEGSGLPVEFEVGDVQELRFDDESFDAARTERLLMHVPDADQAVTEMIRVLRPGGHISVFDFDWETQFCNSSLRETTRRITQSFSDSMKNGTIGSRLAAMFRRNGLLDVSTTYHTVTIDFDFLQLLLGGHVVHAVDAGIILSEEANEWWRDLERSSGEKNFLYGFTAFIVSGTKA